MPPPFPREAVRDLLGLVRAMWEAARAGGASSRRLGRIEAVGRQLQRALKLAERGQEEQALRLAEDAAARVGGLVDSFTAMEPILTAGRARVTGRAAGGRRRS